MISFVFRFYRPVSIVLISLLLQSIVFLSVQASEKNEPSELVFVRDITALKTVNRVAIFFSGTDLDYTNVVQDAVTIELQNLGWDVVSRSELEQAVANDFEKFTSTLTDSTTNTLSQSRDESEIAELVNADAYLTGVVLFGRKQYSIQYDKGNSLTEKVTITTISFQIVSSKRHTILEAVLDFLQGERIPTVAYHVRKLLSDKMR